MKTALIIATLCCFVSSDTWSQSPGGTGTVNLRGWFDAGVGVTLSVTAVTGWQDRAAVGNATQTAVNERPIVSPTLMNYNNALRFDGAEDNFDLADRMATNVTGVSAYAVATHSSTSGDSWQSIFNGQVSGGSWTGGGYGLVSLNAGSTIEGFYVTHYTNFDVSFTSTFGVPYMVSGNWNGTTANAVQAFKNGTSMGTTAYSPGSVGDGGSTWIGSGNGGGPDYCFNGDIAEIAIFNTGLSTTNNNKVMSYLAVKYGITMGINYTNSAGTTIYTTSGTYTNNIIGITRDDGSGLTQKQSKNFDDTVRVYLSTLTASNSTNSGSFASDLSHVIIGADKGSMCSAYTNPEIPPGLGLVRRLTREWKITNTNFDGTFSMDFKLNSCAITGSVTASNLRLVIDDDGNFAAGTYSSIASGSSGITITYANPIITVSGISNSLIPSGATRFITIGSASLSSPLPIGLLDFNATINKSYIDLIWSTASEQNSDFFEIGRSTDASNFEKIMSVPSKALNGNSSYRIDYKVSDDDPISGVSYYQIKQVNKDKSISYKKLIAVNYSKEAYIKIYPQPNDGEFDVNFSGLESNHQVLLVLRDEQGATVFNSSFYVSKDNPTVHVVPENKLTSGIYVCILTLDKKDYKIKVIVD